MRILLWGVIFLILIVLGVLPVLAETCEDGDGGDDPYVDSSITGVNSSGFTDVRTDSCYKMEDYGDLYWKNEYKCPYSSGVSSYYCDSCSPTKCDKSGSGDVTFSYVDSDGGNQPLIPGNISKGIITSFGEFYQLMVHDSCLTSGTYAGQLFEYYNVSASYNYDYVNCSSKYGSDYSCMDGDGGYAGDYCGKEAVVVPVEDCSNYVDDDGNSEIDSTGGCDVDADGTVDFICGCYDKKLAKFVSYGDLLCPSKKAPYSCLDVDTSLVSKGVTCKDRGGTAYQRDSACSSGPGLSLAPEGEQGFFARIWSWITNLFS